MATVLLFYFYLLPRAEVPMQLYALTICAVSVWVVTTFAVGQSSLITTAFLGGFRGLLGGRRANASPIYDLGIALFFWALCLKPSVAFLPVVLLLGAQAWRPLVLGAGLLLFTWISLAGFYGGEWNGLRDYLYLLNHYHNADFTPFMQRAHETDESRRVTDLLFSLERNLILLLSAALLILRWTRRITGSEQFQGMVWIFLLLSPYLLPSENWGPLPACGRGRFFSFGQFARRLRQAFAFDGDSRFARGTDFSRAGRLSAQVDSFCVDAN